MSPSAHRFEVLKHLIRFACGRWCVQRWSWRRKQLELIRYTAIWGEKFSIDVMSGLHLLFAISASSPRWNLWRQMLTLSTWCDAAWTILGAAGVVGKGGPVTRCHSVVQGTCTVISASNIVSFCGGRGSPTGGCSLKEILDTVTCQLPAAPAAFTVVESVCDQCRALVDAESRKCKVSRKY